MPIDATVTGTVTARDVMTGVAMNGTMIGARGDEAVARSPRVIGGA